MDRIIFRMSESGKCPRALSAKLLNIEPEAKPEWLGRAANEGKWHEQRIKDELRADDIAVISEQYEVKLELETADLIGHIDGIVYNHSDKPKLLEIKSMSQFEFDRWMKGGFEAFPNYAAQITCYMTALNLNECLYIVKNRSSGYEDKRTLTEYPTNMSEIMNKLEAVAQCKELYPATFDPQSIECRRCEYRSLCVPEAKELTPIEEAGLDYAAEQWRKGKQLIDEGQQLIDSAKEVFEDHTRVRNIIKWQHVELAIQLVHYSESKTYPKAKLLKIFTEEQLEPALQIKEAFDQLRITDLKEN